MLNGEKKKKEDLLGDLRDGLKLREPNNNSNNSGKKQNKKVFSFILLVYFAFYFINKLTK